MNSLKFIIWWIRELRELFDCIYSDVFDIYMMIIGIPSDYECCLDYVHIVGFIKSVKPLREAYLNNEWDDVLKVINNG